MDAIAQAEQVKTEYWEQRDPARFAGAPDDGTLPALIFLGPIAAVLFAMGCAAVAAAAWARAWYRLGT